MDLAALKAAADQFIADAFGGSLNPELGQAASDYASTFKKNISKHLDATKKAVAWKRSGIDAMSGSDDTKSSIANAEVEAAMNMVGPSALGTFGGIGAATADLAKLTKAKDLLKAGVHPETVWKETGWAKGPDKKWRFEISDHKAAVQPDGVLHRAVDKEAIAQGAPTSFPQWVYMEHPELYKAYPETKSLAIKPTADINGGASFDDVSKTINMSAFAENPKSTNLHELQHAIQQREGFAKGGSPSAPYQAGERDALAKQIALENSAPKVNPNNPYSKNAYVPTYDEALAQAYKFVDSPEGRQMAYQHFGGEAESRLVQSRMNMTPEQRTAQFPYDEGYFKKATGVDLEKLILRDTNGKALSLPEQASESRGLDSWDKLMQLRRDTETARQELSAAHKAGLEVDRTKYDDLSKQSRELYDRLNAAEQAVAPAVEATGYAGEHAAPMADSGSPLHNVIKNGHYPDDVYGPNGLQYYGTGEQSLDQKAYSILQQTKGRPIAQVKMYRAIPKDADATINPGDWVTTVRDYAKMHGEGALGGDYKIVSKTVPAKHLYTNGDSWLEFGYDPLK